MTKSDLFDLSLLVDTLEKLPGGENFVLLKKHLDLEQLRYASDYVFDSILKGIFVSVSVDKKEEINTLMEQERFAELSNFFTGLIILEPLFKQVIENVMNLSVLTIFKKYNLD